MGGYVVSKCKEDEFEGVGVTNFGYPLAMNLLEKKARPSKDCVKIMEHQGFMLREDSIFCISAFKKAVLTI